jgi:hypothetical protein
MIPVIMSPEETPKATVDAGNWLNWTVRKYQGQVYVIAVNNSKIPREASIKVDMPHGDINASFAPLEVRMFMIPEAK